MFRLYLSLGIDHIADIHSYDHILFITCLCAVYMLKQWKQILVLVTAFTIGHTTTLALATLKLVTISAPLVEVLIPVTIIVTASWNLVSPGETVTRKSHWFKYGTALFFGLIHGLGFSNYLQGLLGSETSIVLPLFAFNVGIELGQLLIVSIVIMLSYILTSWLRVKRRDWVLILSGAGIGIAATLIIERLPW